MSIPDRVFVPGGSAAQDTRAYERGPAATRVNAEISHFFADYQRSVRVHGPVLLLLTAIGFVGCLPLRRRGGSAASSPTASRHGVRLLWAVGVTLLVAPAATQSYDMRYVVPTHPFLVAAAVLTLAQPWWTHRRPTAPFAGRIARHAARVIQEPVGPSDSRAQRRRAPQPGPARHTATLDTDA